MSNLVLQYDIGFYLDPDRFLKRMHIDGENEADRNARACVPELLELAEKITKIYAYCFRGHGEDSVMVRQADCCREQWVCLCHLGPEILDRAQSFMEEGEYLKGYLLSEMANDILFHVSSELDRLVEENCLERGMYLTRKYYPGDPGIPIETLQHYLDFLKRGLEPGTLQVRVSSGGMLIPEKAILYVMGADPDNRRISQDHDCSKCSKVNCAFRI